MQASSIQRFLSSNIRFKLFQATHAHGLCNNQVIKCYLRLLLRRICCSFVFSPLFIFTLPYIHGQSKGVQACGSTISNLQRLDMLPRKGLSMGEVGFTTIESRGWSIVDIMEANFVARFKHTAFPFIQDPFQVVPSHSRPCFVQQSSI